MHNFITKSDETGQQIECQNHLFKKRSNYFGCFKKFQLIFFIEIVFIYFLGSVKNGLEFVKICL